MGAIRSDTLSLAPVLSAEERIATIEANLAQLQRNLTQTPEQSWEGGNPLKAENERLKLRIRELECELDSLIDVVTGAERAATPNALPLHGKRRGRTPGSRDKQPRKRR